MTALHLRERINQLLDQASREEQAFLAVLSPEQRAEVGSPKLWSAKDILIHIAIWKEYLVESLDAAALGTPYTALEDIEKTNVQIFEQHRYDPWIEAIELSEQIAHNLYQKILTIETRDLYETQLLSWQRGRPLWRLIVMNGFYHPIDHFSHYYKRDRTDQEGISYSTKIQEEAAEQLKDLDDTPDWLGLVVYNLACHYSQLGEKEKANRMLEEALQFSPELLEWSRKNPDLALIR